MKTPAIEVRLEPDLAMIAWADALKTHLFANVAKDFALDALPSPHISLLQQSVRLDQIAAACRAIENVLVDDKSGGVYKIAAHRYHYTAGRPISLRAITVKPTPQLLWLRKRLTDALSSYSEWSVTSGAPTLLVERAIPEAGSKRLCPTEVETIDDLDNVLATILKPFVFTPSLASIHQVGGADEEGEQLMAVAVASKRSARRPIPSEPIRRFA